MKTESKFKEGDKVRYIPLLSGLKNNTLTIENVFFKESDSLSEALGVEFTPVWCYSFHNSNLTATEHEIKSF